MISPHSLLLRAALLVSLLASPILHADEADPYALNADVELKVALLRPETGPALLPGLRGKIDLKQNLNDYAYWNALGKVTLTSRNELHDENTTANAAIGIFHDALVSSPLPVTLKIEGAVAYESDPTGKNRQWTSGAVFHAVPLFTMNRWGLAPSLWVDYRRVGEEGSTVAQDLGVPLQNYWRTGVGAEWMLRVSSKVDVPEWVRRYRVLANVGYYYSSDRRLALPGGDLKDAWHYHAALNYTVPESSSLNPFISAWEIRIDHGRVPPSTDNRTIWSFAVTVR